MQRQFPNYADLFLNFLTLTVVFVRNDLSNEHFIRLIVSDGLLNCPEASLADNLVVKNDKLELLVVHLASNDQLSLFLHK